MKRLAQSVFWLGFYLVVSLSPLFVVFIGPSPPGRDFTTELSVALGFVGLAMLGLQFILTARFKAIEAPYGVDIMLRFHREISTAAFLIILAHPALILWRDQSFAILNLLEQPPRVWFAVLATLTLTALIVTSRWRMKFHLQYETWRIIHGSLAIATLIFALGHVIGVGHYIADLWQQMLWILMGLASLSVLFYLRFFKPAAMKRKPWKVAEVRSEGGDVWTVACEPDGHEGFEFDAGQFAWLTLWESPFSMEEHPFSISSSALRPERLEFTIKDLGDFTASIKDLPPGSTAYIDGPYGAFSFENYPAAGYVMIAGGIGITPLMSMLRTLADYGDTRPILLIYAAKVAENITFYSELQALEETLEYLRVVYVLESPPEGWQGETGYVTPELLDKYLPEYPARHQYFLCGPPAMLIHVEEALLAVGAPLTHLHAEIFNLV